MKAWSNGLVSGQRRIPPLRVRGAARPKRRLRLPATPRRVAHQHRQGCDQVFGKIRQTVSVESLLWPSLFTAVPSLKSLFERFSPKPSHYLTRLSLTNPEACGFYEIEAAETAGTSAKPENHQKTTRKPPDPPDEAPENSQNPSPSPTISSLFSARTHPRAAAKWPLLSAPQSQPFATSWTSCARREDRAGRSGRGRPRTW